MERVPSDIEILTSLQLLVVDCLEKVIDIDVLVLAKIEHIFVAL